MRDIYVPLSKFRFFFALSLLIHLKTRTNTFHIFLYPTTYRFHTSNRHYCHWAGSKTKNRKHKHLKEICHFFACRTTTSSSTTTTLTKQKNVRTKSIIIIKIKVLHLSSGKMYFRHFSQMYNFSSFFPFIIADIWRFFFFIC